MATDPNGGRASSPAAAGHSARPPSKPPATDEPGEDARLERAETPAPHDDHPESHAPWQTEPPAAVLRRIKLTAAAAYLVFVPISLYLGGFRGLVGLTCAAAVTIIAFLWLEGIVEVVLQPAPKLRSWKVMVRTLARYAFLGTALTVTIIVARFNAVSVLMGFSIIVVGIFGEALYSLYRSLAQQR